MSANEAELTLKITADQAQAVKALLDLGTKLAQMGTELDEAKAKSKTLETAWETVGQQSDKLGMQIALGKQQLKELSTQGISKTHVEYQALKGEIAQNEAALKRLIPSLNQAEREYRQQANAVDKLDAKLKQNTATYAANSAALQKVGVNTNQLQGEFARLTNKAEQTAAALRDQAAAAKTSGESTTRLGSSILGTIASMAGMVAVYTGLQKLKESLVSVIETGGKFESLNISLNTVMGSAAEGDRAFKWIQQFAKDTPLELDGVSQAFIKLKAYGLDPMDGTLQKLVDQNAKMNGSQEDLQGMILAVGQAWTKGALHAQDANQMIERGIPVWELLAKVTGKTAAEAMKMSEAGEITRVHIKGLIDEMGRSSAGAAAAQMKTWSGMVSNLSDNWTQFLNTIANSGALDWLKSKVDQVNTAFTTMTKSGELQMWAEKISASMVATGKSIVGMASAVKEHLGAIKTAAEVAGIAYASVLANGIAKSTVALIEWLAASKAAMGTMSAPFGLWVASILSIGFAWKQNAEALDDYAHRNSVVHELTANVVEGHEKLKQKIEDTIAATKDYADVSFATAAELATMSEQEIKDYIEKTTQAQRYWSAIAMHDKAIGDQQGMKRAEAQADEYGKAIEKANKELGKLANEADATQGPLTGLNQNAEISVSTLDKLRQKVDDAKGSVETLTSFEKEDAATKDQLKAATQALTAAQNDYNTTLEKAVAQQVSATKVMQDGLKDIEANGKAMETGLAQKVKFAELSAQEAEAAGRTAEALKFENEAIAKAGELKTLQVANALAAIDAGRQEAEAAQNHLELLQHTNTATGELTNKEKEALAAAQADVDAKTRQTEAAKLQYNELSRLPESIKNLATAQQLESAEVRKAYTEAWIALATYKQVKAEKDAGKASTEQLAKAESDGAAAIARLAEATSVYKKSAEGAKGATEQLTSAQLVAKNVAGEVAQHNAAIANQQKINAKAEHAAAVARAIDDAGQVHDGETISMGLEDRIVKLNTYGETAKKWIELHNQTINAVSTFDDTLKDVDEFLRLAKAEEVFIEKHTAILKTATESGIGLNAAINESAYAFKHLDAERLNGLNAAITAAKNKMLELEAASKATLNSLQDEMDQLEGNTRAIENRRYQAQIATLKLQAEQAKGDKIANDNAQQSLKLAEEIHSKKLAALKTNETGKTPSGASSSPPNNAQRVADVFHVNLAGPNGSVIPLTGEVQHQEGFITLLRNAKARAQ